MQLPTDSIFNDYQLIFKLKSNIHYKAFTPIYVDEKQFNNSENTRTMNLDAEKFEELLDLYPSTAENLKLRALEKRSIFMYYKEKVTKRSMQQKRSRSMKDVKMGASATMDEVPLKSSRDPELYRSTFEGRDRHGNPIDSDRDQYHITMPFRKSDEIRRKMFEEPEFETDEDYEKEPEE